MDNQIKQELESEIQQKLMQSHILLLLEMALGEKTEDHGKIIARNTELKFKKLSTELVDLVLATQSAGTIPKKAIV